MRLACVLFAALTSFSVVTNGGGKPEEMTRSYGILKSVEAAKIVLAGTGGDKGKTPDQTFQLAADLKVEIDQKPAKLTDLKSNAPISFSYDKNKNVFRISQITEGFKEPIVSGFSATIKSIANYRLIPMFGFSLDLPRDVKVKINGKDAKVEDLKSGDRVEISEDKHGKIYLVEVRGKK
jgi:hypothetical protein